MSHSEEGKFREAAGPPMCLRALFIYNKTLVALHHLEWQRNIFTSIYMTRKLFLERNIHFVK